MTTARGISGSFTGMTHRCSARESRGALGHRFRLHQRLELAAAVKPSLESLVRLPDVVPRGGKTHVVRHVERFDAEVDDLSVRGRLQPFPGLSDRVAVTESSFNVSVRRTITPRAPPARYPSRSRRPNRCLACHHSMMCQHTSMVRTQIQLTDQQARRLRAEARERGVSLAELIRRYVEKGLSEETTDRAMLYARAARVIGRFSDRHGAHDVSAKHDRYLDEAFE